MSRPKLLHLPLTVPGSEQVGQMNGFRRAFGAENHQVFDYLPLEGEVGKAEVNRMLIATIEQWAPDIIWYQRQETDTITPETIKFIRRHYPSLWLTTWSGDARDYAPASLTQVLPYFDIFYNDTNQIDLYKGHAVRYEFMPIAVDWDEVTNFTHPNPNQREIVFLGNNYEGTFSNGPFRKELMHALSVEFGDRFGVYGNGWDMGYVNALGPTPLKHQSAYYRQAKCIISIDHIRDILHWSERLPWALASETPVLMQRQPGIEAWFRTHETGAVDADLLVFDTIEECIRLTHQIIEDAIDPGLGSNGAQKIKEQHLWIDRAKQIKHDWERRLT